MVPDREKVINVLKQLDKTFSANSDGIMTVSCDVMHFALSDALTLLKEQEPIPNGKRIKAGDVVISFYECGYCKNAIRKPWRYCPHCGREVKWN